ncbi:hypothetical protein DFAR_3440001 [Desulfarculales bacterium]
MFRALFFKAMERFRNRIDLIKLERNNRGRIIRKLLSN